MFDKWEASVKVTSRAPSRYEIGKTSVEMILDRLAGKKTPQKRDLGFELIEGESS